MTSFKEKYVTPDHFMHVIVAAFLLTLNSGAINGIAFFDSKFTVANVSGYGTQIGLSIGSNIDQLNNNDLNINIVYVISIFSSFIFGATISGILLPNSKFEFEHSYGRVLLLEAVLLLIAFFCDKYGENDQQLWLFPAAMACGMQNAMTTSFSGNVLRTTHLTGTATDIGIIFGRHLRGLQSELWKLALFLPMTLGFILGGCCGYYAYKFIGPPAILINCSIITLTAIGHTIALIRHTGLNAKDILIHEKNLSRKYSSANSNFDDKPPTL